MSDYNPIIKIGSVEIIISLSGDTETAKKEWEKAKKVINTYLEVEEPEDEVKPDAQQSTAQQGDAPKKKKRKAWSTEEEDILTNNLDKTPAELKNLLYLYGYDRTYGAVDQKQRQMLEQEQEQQEEDEEVDYKKGPWDDWEEEHLINEYHNKTISEIAGELNRPYHAVYQRKAKLVSEGRLTPKEKQKTPDDRINEIKQEAEHEDEPEIESGDNIFPHTLIKYLWRNTDWRNAESRDDRVEGIQDLIKDRYGTDISKEEIENIVDEAEIEDEA